MPNDRKLYFTLFNRVTETILQIDKHNYGKARDLLVEAQQEAEELYLLEETGEQALETT